MHTLLFSLAISQKSVSEQKAVTENDSPVLSPSLYPIQGLLLQHLCH